MNADKNILYLSYDGLTDPLGQSQILPYIQGLSTEGFTFTIISFEKPARYKALGLTIQKICDKSNITWKPLSYTKRPPVLSTLYDVEKLYRTVTENNPVQFDLIHCRSYLTALVALRLKKKFGIPFIFDMRGFWADERVDGKIWKLKNPVYKLIFNYFKKKERAFLEEAAAVVSLTNAGKSEIERWFDEDSRFGGDPNYYNHDRALAIRQKTTVIPCAADLAHFDPAKITTNKKKWLCAVHGLDPNLDYLGYVGSLGTWYMATEMLGFFANISKTQPKLRFLVISQDNLESLYTEAEAMGIPRSYIIHIKAERKEVPALMSLMSASVFFILPAYSKMASSPTKQGELMGMGIPVICNDQVGDTGEIIRKYQAGEVTTEFTQAAYEAIAQKWDSITSLDPTQIREGAKDYFSLTAGVEAYAQIYRNILYSP